MVLVPVPGIAGVGPLVETTGTNPLAAQLHAGSPPTPPQPNQQPGQINNTFTPANPTPLQDIIKAGGDIGGAIKKGVTDPHSIPLLQLLQGVNQGVGDIGRFLFGTNQSGQQQSSPNISNIQSEMANKPATSAEMQPNLTYQGAVSSLMKPYIQGMTLNKSQLANATNPGGGYVPANLQQSIAHTLQTSVNDYQSGLNAMLGTLPTQQGLAAEITGIKSLIAYPYNITAPPSVQSNPVLMQLYSVLEAMRSGNPLPSSAGGAGYGQVLTPSVLQTG